jgi:beta-lactamase class A
MNRLGGRTHARLVAALSTSVAMTGAAACTGGGLPDLQTRLEARIAEGGAETVGLHFHDLEAGDSLLLGADVRVHAASTMKVPVMIQLYRDQDAGLLDLDDSVRITKTFRSIVDGSAYDLGAPDDSDTLLYRRIGERESIRALMERMITVSSNLATNILIELVGADRTQATMRELGADSIVVLRGVEDGKAYRAGLNNTTTARDLGVIFTAIAERRAASPSACDEMIAVLLRQEFSDNIPAGLPPGTPVAHKTGWIDQYVTHDAGVVYRPDGSAYVLVVLTSGDADDDAAELLIADLSRIVWEYTTGR